MPTVRFTVGEFLISLTIGREYTAASMSVPMAAAACLSLLQTDPHSVPQAKTLQHKSAPLKSRQGRKQPGRWPDPVINAPILDISAAGGAVSTVRYTDGVEVDYGVTKLRADTVVIDWAHSKGTATGHVHVDDPDAKFDAEEIDFSWDPAAKSGHVTDFDGRLEGLIVRSSSIDAAPGKIVLNDIQFEPGHWKSLYRVRSKRLSYVAGKYVELKNPDYRILGVAIPWHKTLHVSQDPRSNGVSLPALSFSGGSVGMNYDPSFFTDPQTLFQSWTDLFAGDLPHYGFELAHSYYKPSVPNQTRIVPPSELDTRFGYGYFDNVKIHSPQVEYLSERQLRSTIGFDSIANQGSNDRLPGGSVSKLAELFYSSSGPWGPLGQVSDLRLQSARQQGQSAFTTRLVADTSIGIPPIKLLPNLETALRFDTQGFASERLFGWEREQIGLVEQPFHGINLSAAYVTAKAWGSPDLTTDELYNNGAWCFRVDAYFKSIQASYLLRYYLNGIFLDNEYQISQAVGAFRVFVLYRTFPSDFRFGATFRLDELIDSIKRHHEPPSQ